VGVSLPASSSSLPSASVLVHVWLNIFMFIPLEISSWSFNFWNKMLVIRCKKDHCSIVILSVEKHEVDSRIKPFVVPQFQLGCLGNICNDL
jgi:hypothetical protein